MTCWINITLSWFAMKIAEVKTRRTQINLTALIDVLFLLIIFFAVSTKFAEQEAVPLELPVAKTSQKLALQTRLLITMKDTEHLSINGTHVPWAELGKTLKNPLFDRSKKVALNIDKAVPHGQVIELLDHLRQAKFEKVAFGTTTD